MLIHCFDPSLTCQYLSRKTQDILSFVYEYKDLRPVYWIDSSTIDNFITDYRHIATIANLPGHDAANDKQILEMVKRWLEGLESGDWILVLDNSDNYCDFFPDGNARHDAISIDGLHAYIP